MALQDHQDNQDHLDKTEFPERREAVYVCPVQIVPFNFILVQDRRTFASQVQEQKTFSGSRAANLLWSKTGEPLVSLVQDPIIFSLSGSRPENF